MSRRLRGSWRRALPGWLASIRQGARSQPGTPPLPRPTGDDRLTFGAGWIDPGNAGVITTEGQRFVLSPMIRRALDRADRQYAVGPGCVHGTARVDGRRVWWV
jgi:hypothetical protein